MKTNFYKEKLFKNRSILFFLMYGLYILFFEDQITELVIHANRERIELPLMGYILLFLQPVELFALLAKWLALNARVKKRNLNILGVILVWGFHAVLSFLLLNTALGYLGIKLLDKHSSMGMPLIFLLVIKELIILYPLFSMIMPREIKMPKININMVIEFIADTVLLVYLCLVYSVIWKGSAETSGGVGHGLLSYFAFSVLFLMLYIPMAFSEIIENLMETDTFYGRIQLGFCIIFPLVCMHIDRLG